MALTINIDLGDADLQHFIDTMHAAQREAKGLSATLKYADYRADAFARDTRKLWLQLDYKGSRAL